MIKTPRTIRVVALTAAILVIPFMATSASHAVSSDSLNTISNLTEKFNEATLRFNKATATLAAAKASTVAARSADAKLRADVLGKVKAGMKKLDPQTSLALGKAKALISAATLNETYLKMSLTIAKKNLTKASDLLRAVQSLAKP